jgi:hypothetical protein
MTDRYTKVLLTIIALSLIWIGVKDTRLEPVVSAQSATWEEQFQDWDENALASGLPDANLLLPASGYAYLCYTRLYAGAAFAPYGDSGALYLRFYSEPNCGGDFIGTARIYSEGATASQSHASYLYREAALLSVYENAARAAGSGQRVYYYRCSATKTNCIKFLSFGEGPAV